MSAPDADIIAEVERLRAALRRIADHHDEQRALWRDEMGDYDAAIYHEDRRNVALFHLLNTTPSDAAEAD